MSTGGPPGTTPRAARSRRPGLDAVLAVVLPVAGVLLLLLVRPGAAETGGSRPPTGATLVTSTVVCPSALPGTVASAGPKDTKADLDAVGTTTLAEGPRGSASGDVSVAPSGTDGSAGPGATSAQVGTGSVTALTPGTAPVVVSGSGDLAPGLLAGRSASQGLAAVDCGPPQGDQWFTGVGAGPSHDSVVELVNPGSGVAEADVTVWSSAGEVEVDRLRGVSVPGGQSTRLDLGQLAPRRGSLAIQVHVDRGQLAADVVDAETELATGQQVRDWMPGQGGTSSSALLLGLASGDGDRTLTLLNPGSSEVRATLQVVTATGVFAPSGVDPVRVPAGATQTVSLGAQLAQQTAQGAIGLLVTGSGPLTAGLRQSVAGDLSDLAPAPALTSSSGAVVPEGAKRLVLADPSAVGVAQVAWFGADGTRLGGQSVELRPDTGADVTVPDDATLVTVEPQRTTVRAAVVVSGTTGIATVALRDLQRTSRVPAVAPGLP